MRFSHKIIEHFHFPHLTITLIRLQNIKIQKLVGLQGDRQIHIPFGCFNIPFLSSNEESEDIGELSSTINGKMWEMEVFYNLMTKSHLKNLSP